MTTIQVTHGLTQSPKVINLSHTEMGYLENNNDLYEVTFVDDKPCRAFVDLDGKMSLETDEMGFELMNDRLLTTLSEIDFGTPVSICTSSKYNNKNWNPEHGEYSHKLSFSLVFPKKYGSKQAVQNWTRDVIAPMLKKELNDILPFFIKGVDQNCPDYDYLDYDNSVYRKGGKMRALYSTKPNEERPKVIHGECSPLDTLITYVPANCERLPEPVQHVTNEVIVPVEFVAQFDDTLHDVVMSLNKERADDRKDWLTVGMALHHEGASVETWVEFSKQSAKYKWGECERLWRGFKKGNLTQRSLWKMLKEDKPDVFKSMCSKRNDLEEAFGAGPTHFRYGQHFVNCMPDAYLYDASGWWYVQANKTWANSAKIPPTLATVISRTLFSELDQWASDVRVKLFQCEDEGLKTFYESMMKKSLKGRDSCLQSSFIKGVIDFCQGFYAENTAVVLDIVGKKDVRELMDSNPMLFAFKDSVYDFTLIEGKAVGKRPIDATDYITITCGYNFPTKNSAVRQQMEATLKSIWSKQGEHGDNGETYEYAMKILSSTLCGTRWMEAFYILTGSGRNGKGLLFELLQAVMGDYYYQLPVQVLTTKIDNPRAPNPDIANLVGKRIACSSEPEANEKLYEGTVKYMTGGDKLTGRALYGAPVQYKPQFGLFMQCNTIPNFNGITRGGVMRNRVIPFPFEFKEEPASDREKKSNPLIKDVLCKSTEWRDEMFHILLDHFESIRGKGIDGVKMSKLVEERTNEYVSENNLIGCWWMENYVRAEGVYVLSKDAYTEFKAETGSLISDKQFKAGLEFNLLEVKKIKRGAMKDKMGVANWRRKTQEEMAEKEPGSDDDHE